MEFAQENTPDISKGKFSCKYHTGNKIEMSVMLRRQSFETLTRRMEGVIACKKYRLISKTKSLRFGDIFGSYFRVLKVKSDLSNLLCMGEARSKLLG